MDGRRASFIAVVAAEALSCKSKPSDDGFAVRCNRFWLGARNVGMLLVIAILLLLFWGGGFAFHVAGGLIHLLLVIALILFILHFVRGGSNSV